MPRRLAIIVFCLLALAGMGAIVGTFSADRAERWYGHSLRVRGAETELLSAIQDAETGQRGYLLTGDPDYLDPFNAAQRNLPELRARLLALTTDNHEQQVRLARLDQLIDAKMTELSRTIDLYRGGRREAAIALVKTNLGRTLMRQIRSNVTDFDAIERRLLTRREADATGWRAAIGIIVPLAVILAALLAAIWARSAWLYERALEQRNSALGSEIANRERVEAQLRQTQKMEALGQLTGGVAHDFNNMLAIILGSLSLLKRRLPSGDATLGPLVDGALTGANRAADLTRRLLAFSRLQPLEPKSTDVNRCVSDMSDVLRRTLGEKVIIETVLAGGLWRALIDCPQLESAILNLSVNARDAMPEGGKLTLETSNAALDGAYADQHLEVTPGQYVLVAVTDTGTGMPPETVARAFDPFFTTKGVGEGTGLGLSQVHGFVKQSKGHVKIYSEVGVGTTIKLYLPRDPGGQATYEPVRHGLVKPIEGDFTILVAEDDPGVRQVTTSALRELGFDVLEADSASVALELLDEHPEVSVLLTDVVMPITDGKRLVEAATRRRPDIAVIYMTGYTRNAIVHNGALDAGTRLLTKPFTVEQLERELRLALAERAQS
jgi:signal transduction histidine kinase/ActR/RegA family two-component response regulator